MVAGADGYALGVQDGADVVGVDVFYDEGQYTSLARRSADDAQAADGLQGLGAVLQQFVLVGGEGFVADGLDVVHRRAKADGSGDVGGAGLELVGQVVVDGLLEGHRLDHLSAALHRGHGVQQLRLAV